MPVESLHTRAARVLGWSEREVTSVSFHTLRELVRPLDVGLADDLSHAIRSGSYIAGRQMFTANMTWLGEPPPVKE